MSGKSSRLGLWIPWALFALAVLGWIAYWNVARVEALKQVNAALEAERANGADTAINSIKVQGFPLRLSLRLLGAHYAPSDRTWRMSADRVLLNINLSNPSHIMLTPESALRWAKPGGETLTISPRSANMSVRLRGKDLARLSVLATDVTITDSRGAPKSATMARLLIHARPDVRDPSALQIALEADDWNWGQAPTGFEGFGPRLQQIRAALSIEQRAFLMQGVKADPLSVWRQKGAQLRVETLQIQWGDVSVTGVGAMTLDAQVRPQGAVNFEFADAAKTLDALSGSAIATPDARAGLRILGAGMALTGGQIKAPLQAKDGWWRLGPAPLWPAKPIYRL